MATSGDDGSKQAAEFMSKAIDIVAAHDKARPDAQTDRLFFPDGIDMISLKFKVGSAVDISLAISGKSCCKSALSAQAARPTESVRTTQFLASATSVQETSLEADATDCLIEAIAAITNVEVGPEELADLKPADVGFEDDLAWLRCLNRAANCLRQKGYEIEDFTSAEELFGKVLDSSLGALIDRVQS